MSSSLTTPRRAPSLADLVGVWLLVPALSIIGHAAFIALLLGASTLTAPAKPKKVASRPVTLQKIDARRWAAARGKPASTSPTLEKPVELNPKGQVVDVAPGNNQVAPDAKYLAETNNRVKTQTVARVQTNKYSKAAPKTAADSMLMPMARGRSAPSLLGSNPAELFTSPLGTRQPRLSEIFQAPSKGSDESAPAASGATGDPSEPAAPGGETEGGGAPNDALDVARGDGTYLNTREWQFAGFFNRMKQAVSAQWDPNGRLRSKGRQLGMDKKTVMTITLRPDGSIADLFVSKSSGVDELDQEAMKAFEKSQPYPNPPQALFAHGGYYQFEFGFLVSSEGMGGFGTPQFFRTPR